MEKFLCFNTPNLHHLSLSNCGVSLKHIERRTVKVSSWADFFAELVIGATALRSLTLQNHLNAMGLFSRPLSAWEDLTEDHVEVEPNDSGLYPEQWEYQDKSWIRRRAQALLRAQEAQRPTMTDKEWAQRRPVLHYMGIRGHEPYEIWCAGIQTNAHRYVRNDDYKALMALSRDMEARGGEGFINAIHET